jgi:glycerate-2-kinase
MKKIHFSIDGTKHQNSLISQALDVAEAGIDEVVPKKVIANNVVFKNNNLSIDGKSFPVRSRLYVIGAGKASALMAVAIEKILPLEKISGGIINSNVSAKTKKIEIVNASHPIPDNSGIKGVKKILHLTRNLKENDIVLCLFSGGGSALLTLPVEGVSLSDLQKLTKKMINGGVQVYEMQKVRKHLSQVKGGKLAEHLFPAQVISVVISDLINPQDVVAAGPLEPDLSTYKEAIYILKKYKLWPEVSQNIKEYLKRGVLGKIVETPKPGNKVFKNVKTFTLANNKTALERMTQKVELMGYKSIVRKKPLLGDIKKASKEIAQEITELSKNNKNLTAYLYSSELVVKNRGRGKGGRCQEHTARVAQELQNKFNYTLLSVGSDGVDYLSGVAGAVVNQNTYQSWLDQQIDVSRHLRDNNSHLLHIASNTLVKGEKTGTNVGDINVCLIKK